MNHFQISLDRYLTTPPDDGWDQWYELVECKMTESFWETHEDTFLMSDLYNKWMMKLGSITPDYDIDEDGYPIEIGYMTPELAAQIIERAYKIYEKCIK